MTCDNAPSPILWPQIPRQAWSKAMTASPAVMPEPVYATLHDGGPWQGIPLGGFGTGGIGRGYRGAFGRWTVKAGCLKHFCMPANMFAVRVASDAGPTRAVALHPGYPEARPGEESGRKVMQAWDWSYDAAGAMYHGLFPKAWYEYPHSPALPLELTCEQFSPVIPHDYVATSLPVGVFAWHARNPGKSKVRVSLLFSFVNMTGWFSTFGRGRPEHLNAGNQNTPVSQRLADGLGTMRGVILGRDRQGEPLTEGDGQFCIAALETDRHAVSVHTAFDPMGNGARVWKPFSREGRLSNDSESPRAIPVQHVAGAVCVSFDLEPGETTCVPMVLTWDLPVIEFGSGRQHLRQYTRHVGADGTHAGDLACQGLVHWRGWSEAIDAWHRDVIGDQSRPDWYYSLLLNEAYLAVDGLTVWTDGTRDAPGEDPFFGVIECPDYPYYCTLDLWVYGSFFFLAYWPELEKNVIRRFARAILHADDFSRRSPHTGELFASKVKGAAPHDFGEPEEDPPLVCNSYVHQDSNRWKDLNCQYVLALYRDVLGSNDTDLLRDCWPAVTAAIEYLAGFDTDGDGLIENDGTPDQTMDNIPMKGPSSYCGGLWMAALGAAVKMAGMLDDHRFVSAWGPRSESAAKAFDERLWNGEQYRFDTEGHSPDALFIDALFGIWYGRLCGLRNLLPEDRYRAHLLRVYEYNVLAFDDGRLGGANITGWHPPVRKNAESAFNTGDCQISEVLSGLNISFACQLMDAGLDEEAMHVLGVVYNVVYREFGLWFRTPAAWTRDGRFRAIMNLRPLVVWALEVRDISSVGSGVS